MKILGIESSCDDTSVAILDNNRNILANVVKSQNKIHKPYKGIVPELAARSHVTFIDNIFKEALLTSNTSIEDIKLISATAGPGLIGGLLVGLTFAKTVSQVRNIPFVAVNHLEGHALTARLSGNVQYPFLLLLVSGGHSNFYYIENINRYFNLGGTLDDALGEAFDKVAKIIGLGFPGGAALEKVAKYGNSNAYDFPRPLYRKNNLDLSFSGLKTAIQQKYNSLNKEDNPGLKADIAASFQKTICKIICKKIKIAIDFCNDKKLKFNSVVISGGVASNMELRTELKRIIKSENKEYYFPPINLCTDNAAMIAWAGYERFKKKLISPLNTSAKPRWPLEDRHKIL